MSKLEIPHDALVFIGDGRKALFMCNAGDEKSPNFLTERMFIDDNPPTHEQRGDRPGRAFKRARTNLRSGVGDTDWHELEEHRFAQRVAGAMEGLVYASVRLRHSLWSLRRERWLTCALHSIPM